jgi:hypothetical protein
MGQSDTQVKEPGSELCIPVVATASPRTTIIGKDALRKPVATKGGLHLPLHRIVLLIGAGREPQREPGMVIKRSQTVATSLVEGKISHEVDLPQQVGSYCLKPLKITLGSL